MPSRHRHQHAACMRQQIKKQTKGEQKEMAGGEEGKVNRRLHQTNGPHGDCHGTETAVRERTNERTDGRTRDRANETKPFFSAIPDTIIASTHPSEIINEAECCLAVSQASLLCDVRRCDRQAHFASEDADPVPDPQLSPTNRPFQSSATESWELTTRCTSAHHRRSPSQITNTAAGI